MIGLLVLNLVLLGYLFYKEHKYHQLIREILAFKASPEMFQELVNPSEIQEAGKNMISEPLLDEVDAEELAKNLEGSVEE
jgi:hypothetical protein